MLLRLKEVAAASYYTNWRHFITKQLLQIDKLLLYFPHK